MVSSSKHILQPQLKELLLGALESSYVTHSEKKVLLCLGLSLKRN